MQLQERTPCAAPCQALVTSMVRTPACLQPCMLLRKRTQHSCISQGMHDDYKIKSHAQVPLTGAVHRHHLWSCAQGINATAHIF
eukprot:355423-Pelagomonas_calceolata.AAC.7